MTKEDKAMTKEDAIAAAAEQTEKKRRGRPPKSGKVEVASHEEVLLEARKKLIRCNWALSGKEKDDEIIAIADKIKEPRMVRILINEKEGHPGGCHVVVNNYETVLPRGEEVVVPEFVVDALRNATMTYYEYREGDKEPRPRNVATEVFSVLGFED